VKTTAVSLNVKVTEEAVVVDIGASGSVSLAEALKMSYWFTTVVHGSPTATCSSK